MGVRKLGLGRKRVQLESKIIVGFVESDMEAASWLVEEQVKAVAMDSSKNTLDPAPVERQPCPVNRIFLGPSVLFIGNSIGPVKIPHSRRFMVFAAPSKIQGESGGPARVSVTIEA